MPVCPSARQTGETRVRVLALNRHRPVTRDELTDALWSEGSDSDRLSPFVGRSCVEIGAGELDTAERAARTLIERAPFRDSGHRLLIETLIARGNAAEVLLVYDALRRRLREELGVASTQTQDLHRRLLG